MKTFVALLAFCAVALAKPETDWKEKAQEMQAQYERVKGVCAQKFELNKDELIALDTMEPPKNKRDKCTLECVFTESGIMENGLFSREGAYNFAEYMYDDDDESLEMAKMIAKKCEKIITRAKLEDGCETAAATLTCLRKLSKHLAHKIDPDYKA